MPRPEALYFDHNAATPVRPEVARRVEQVARETFGNPSSQHIWGRAARAQLEEARDQLARALGVEGRNLVFASGGTEANRLALLGAFEGQRRTPPGESPPRSLVSGLEHPSVIEVHEELAALGRCRPFVLPATSEGRVDLGALTAALEPGVRLVSIQHANSETGVVQPVEQVARILEGLPSPRPLLHVDAVQSFGKIEVNPVRLGADLLTISSHKVGGPRGAGVLWIRPGADFTPSRRGGPQENRMRPGTENLPAIVGFALAADLAERERASYGPGWRTPASVLSDLLSSGVEGSLRNGAGDLLPNTLNVSFEKVPAELLVIRLDQEGLAVSSGTACSSGSREPSRALLAMGLSPERVRSAIRFSSGWTTRPEDLEECARIVCRTVKDLRTRQATRGEGRG